MHHGDVSRVVHSVRGVETCSLKNYKQAENHAERTQSNTPRAYSSILAFTFWRLLGSSLLNAFATSRTDLNDRDDIRRPVYEDSAPAGTTPPAEWVPVGRETYGETQARNRIGGVLSAGSFGWRTPIYLWRAQEGDGGGPVLSAPLFQGSLLMDIFKGQVGGEQRSVLDDKSRREGSRKSSQPTTPFFHG